MNAFVQIVWICANDSADDTLFLSKMFEQVRTDL